MTRLSGEVRYIVALLRALARLKPWQMALTWDGGGYEGPAYLLSVCNSPRTGGFMMAPGALLDDGLLDMVFAPQVSKGQVIAILLKLMRGEHIHHPAVTFQPRDGHRPDQPPRHAAPLRRRDLRRSGRGGALSGVAGAGAIAVESAQCFVFNGRADSARRRTEVRSIVLSLANTRRSTRRDFRRPPPGAAGRVRRLGAGVAAVRGLCRRVSPQDSRQAAPGGRRRQPPRPARRTGDGRPAAARRALHRRLREVRRRQAARPRLHRHLQDPHPVQRRGAPAARRCRRRRRSAPPVSLTCYATRYSRCRPAPSTCSG